jgi:hypothetical protein
MNHAHIETIDIGGGLTDDATGDFASIGDTLIEREEGELVMAFRARACARAFAFGGSHVVFGGLLPVKYEDEPTQLKPEGYLSNELCRET